MPLTALFTCHTPSPQGLLKPILATEVVGVVIEEVARASQR